MTEEKVEELNQASVNTDKEIADEEEFVPGEDKLLLTDLLELCLDFKENPTDESEKKIVDFVNKFNVISYMPIQSKQIALALILNSATITEQDIKLGAGSDMDITDVVLNLEAGKLIYGLLPYVINLENDLGAQGLNMGVLDLLYQFGIADHILQYCRLDFDRLDKMVEEANNYSNLAKLADNIALMSPENMAEFTNVIIDLKNELTAEKLKDLKALATAGDPRWSALKETVADEAIGKAMENDFVSSVMEKK